MSIELYPSIAKIKRNGVYENLPGFVPETGAVATQQMIATSESSATAQYVHNKGEYFRLNDTLYQAIVKINVGDAIVVGTNCEVSVLGNDITHIANSIADYELGIATNSHNTGDYFMVGETLYVATSDIQVGDTISTSTNCRKAVVGDELSELKTAITQNENDIQEVSSAMLKDNQSGEIIHFTDGTADVKFDEFKVSFEPIRSGSGNPSPTNKREFADGATSVNIYVSPTEQQADAEVTEITFPNEAGKVYRAEIDLKEKTLTVLSVHKKLVGNGSEGISLYSGSRFRIPAQGFKSPSSATALPDLQADILETTTKAAIGQNNYRISPSDSGRAELLMLAETTITSVDDLNTWLQTNNVEIDYPLEIPVVYELTDEMISMLQGENYVWSSVGTIELTRLVSIDGLINNIDADQCTFIAEQEYKNLFNPSDEDITYGYYINHQGSLVQDNAFLVSGYVPVKGGETYIFPFYSYKFGTGTNARSIPVYDGNKNYINYITGTLITVDGTSSPSFLELTFSQTTQVKFMRVTVIGLDVNSKNILSQYHTHGNFMIIEGEEFPTRFYPYIEQPIIDKNIYSGHENLANPLYTKRVVFLGDSICEGDSESGWAGRIGRNNTMLWENDGIGGSTISTAMASKTICTRPIMTEEPDYIIFEGGTNDADRIGDATGETKPAAFGTWDEEEYGTDDVEAYYGFDIDTFCGAVDYLCKRLVSTYAGKKIGFIGAQKMGTSASSRKNRGYYIKTAMDICKKWGIPCVDLWNESYLNPLIPSHYTSGEDYLYSDGQHLTSNGYNYIAPIIEAWMKTL